MPRSDAFDSDASSFFALAGLTCVVVPWTFSKLLALLAPGPSEAVQWKSLGFGRAAPVVAKAVRLGKGPGLFRVSNLIFVACFVAECSLVGNALLAYEHAVFDPYETLGIRSGASAAQIRKAYRRLALEFHPDKNQAPEARRTFHDVVKAHAVLTDETARKNFERYGNPDGYQGMSSGVGLPSWMSDEWMILPMLLLVILTPLLALYCMRDPRAREAAAVGRAARDACLRAALCVSEDEDIEPYLQAMRFRPAAAAQMRVDEAALAPGKLVPIVASAFAHRPPLGGEKSGPSEAQREAVRELRAKLKLPKVDESQQADGDDASQLLRETLLHAHLRSRADGGGGGRVGASLRAEQAALFEATPAALDALFKASVAVPALSFRLGVARALQFAQAVTQAVPPGISFLSLVQVPHVDEARARAMAGADSASASAAAAASFLPQQISPKAKPGKAKGGKGGKGGGKGSGEAAADEVAADETAADEAPAEAAGVKGVAELCAMGAARRAAVLREAGLSEAEAAEAEAFCGLFPRASLRLRAFTAGEDEGASIVAQDVVTIEAALDIERAAGGAAAALPAHAPLYPHRKAEGWVVVMCEAGEGRVLDVKPVATDKPAKLQVGAGGAGTRKLEVHALCGAYLGADTCEPLVFEVKAEADSSDEEEEEDEEEEDEDEEDEDEEDEDSDESDESDDAVLVSAVLDDEDEDDEVVVPPKPKKGKGSAPQKPKQQKPPPKKRGPGLGLAFTNDPKEPSKKAAAKPAAKTKPSKAPAAPAKPASRPAPAATTAAAPAAAGSSSRRLLLVTLLLLLFAWAAVTLADDASRARLVSTLLDAAYQWGWLGNPDAVPDLGDLQDEPEEPPPADEQQQQ